MVVVIHGGFWKKRYDRSLMWAVSGDLVARGCAVWNIEYRRLGFRGGGGWPATGEDVTAAVEYLQQFDRLDLDRVSAVGHSAGGHLAAWLAATNDQRTVKLEAACAQAGVVDLLVADRHPGCRRNLRRFLGGDPEAFPEADPARLTLTVPVLCVHGAADATVPLAVSEAFCRTHPTAVLRVFGDDHMGHIDPHNAMWQSAAAWLTAA